MKTQSPISEPKDKPKDMITIIGYPIGEEPPACDSVLESCGLAVRAQEKALADQQQVIENLKAVQVLEREELSKAKEPHWYTNPVTLIGLGLIGGIIVRGQVK